MTRLCDGYPGNHACPRRNPCEGDCHFNNANLDNDLVTPHRTAHIEVRAGTVLRTASAVAVVLLTCVFFGMFMLFVVSGLQ